MTRRLLDTLGPMQQAIMSVVWELGEATVRQVFERLGRGRELAYTTILSSMQKLDRAGWLEHRAEGRTYFYRAVRTEGEERTRSVRGFVDRMFGGSPVLAFQHLLDAADKLSEEELAELQTLIRQKREEARDGCSD